MEGVPVDAGRLVLSPTRTYAPVIKALLAEVGPRSIDGMVHCTGGAQTKVLNFVGDLHVIKDDLFEVPPLFECIRRNSGADPAEMYRVFNMGHRFEIYCSAATAQTAIGIARSFNIDAKVIGRVEAADSKALTLVTPYGTLHY